MFDNFLFSNSLLFHSLVFLSLMRSFEWLTPTLFQIWFGVKAGCQGNPDFWKI